MLSKKMKSIFRPFYRIIIKKGLENGELIKLGSINKPNSHNYKIYDWSCANPNFPDFFSGGSYGKYNSLRNTLRELSKQKYQQYDDRKLRLITLAIRYNLYSSPRLPLIDQKRLVFGDTPNSPRK